MERYKLMTFGELEKARRERASRVGAGKAPEPTKTGRRASRAEETARRAHRKVQAEKRRIARELAKGKFFLRTVEASPEENVMGIQILPARRYNAKIAKLVEGDLWIRRDHACEEDEDPVLWSKAKNAGAPRLNAEIRSWGAYLTHGEVREEDAQEVLDLLYFHLADRLDTP